jgi:uncharacterized protein YbaP (TraB family)
LGTDRICAEYAIVRKEPKVTLSLCQSINRIASRWVAALGVGAVLVLAAGGFAAAGERMPFGQGLLWKVERSDVAPSHVFGTIHSTDSRVRRLPKPVNNVVRSAKIMILEVARTDDMPIRMARLMMLRDGKRLEEILGTDLFRQFAEVAGRYGLPANLLQRIKPWAALMTISLPPQEKSRQAAGKLPLDLALGARAQKRGIPVYGLETVEEQLNLFEDLPEADQISLLQAAIRDHDKVGPMFERMIKTYLERDLEGLMTWAIDQTAGKDKRHREIFEVRFLERRNRLMVDRMQPRLAAGGALVAVGAAHLPGENGVLSLLAKQGYSITRVY